MSTPTTDAPSIRSMRAAVVREHGGIDRIAVDPCFPRPVARSGWVALRVRACVLNFHDIFSRRGMPGIKLPLPIIIGSDIAGEIAEIGAGVEGWSAGDRVLVDPAPCEGTDFKFIGEQFLTSGSTRSSARRPASSRTSARALSIPSG